MTKKIYYFMLLCFLTIVFSCKDDDLRDLNHTHNSSHQTKMNKVSFEEMQNFIKENAKGIFPKSLNLISNKGSEIYITDIDSTQITQIYYEGITTFTLPVKTRDEDKYVFSDLIFNIKNGELQEYIYHYNPSEHWL